MYAHTKPATADRFGKNLIYFFPLGLFTEPDFFNWRWICLGAYQYCIVYGQCIVGPVPTSAIRIWSIGGCLGRAEIHDRARAYSTVLYRFTNLNTVLFNFDS
jgi:hypothetical protein